MGAQSDALHAVELPASIWRASGDTIPLPQGVYEIRYKGIDGYQTPKPTSIEVTEKSSIGVTQTYTRIEQDPPRDYYAYGKQAYLYYLHNGPKWIRKEGHHGVFDIRYPYAQDKHSFQLYIQHHRDESFGRTTDAIEKVAVRLPPQSEDIQMVMHDNFRIDDPGMDLIGLRYGQPPRSDFVLADTGGALLEYGSAVNDNPMRRTAWGCNMNDADYTNNCLYYAASERRIIQPLEWLLTRESIVHNNILGGSYYSSRSLYSRKRMHSDKVTPHLGDYLYMHFKAVPKMGSGRMWFYYLRIGIAPELWDDFVRWLGDYEPNGFDSRHGDKRGGVTRPNQPTDIVLEEAAEASLTVWLAPTLAGEAGQWQIIPQSPHR